MTKFSIKKVEIQNYISELREKLKLAKRIIKDSPALEEKLETEKQLIREWYFPERQMNKEKDYEER